MFVRRSSTGSGHFLAWRVRLFGVAAILAVFGIAAELGWMVNIAIGVLAISLVLGMLEGRGGEEDDEDEDAEETGASGHSDAPG